MTDQIPGSERLTDDDVILVTGGTGLFGSGIAEVVKQHSLKGNWVFAGSKDGDLTSKHDCEQLFQRVKPTYVLHLAAFVGGLFNNMNNKVSFWMKNVSMNNNILELCYQYKVKKVVSCLSTCIFPDKVQYPITETVLHEGPPHWSNDAYAYAKRMLDMLGRWYNEQEAREQGNNGEKHVRFTSVIPTNLFGPHDNYNVQSGHVLPGLIHKGYLAKKNGGDFVVYGTGKPLRQFLYSVDAGHLIIWALLNYNEQEPLTISVGEEDEISIGQAAQHIKEALNYERDLVFDTSKSDGQFKKTASNEKLRRLYPDFKFTPFGEGLKKSVDWFVDNYETARK